MSMCLAVPGKVVELHGDWAKVDYGGVVREANVSLVEVSVGEYVIVHAGFAIQKLDKEAADESLRLWDQIFQYEAEMAEANLTSGEEKG